MRDAAGQRLHGFRRNAPGPRSRPGPLRVAQPFRAARIGMLQAMFRLVDPDRQLLVHQKNRTTDLPSLSKGGVAATRHSMDLPRRLVAITVVSE
jgi:hypothetical protein